MPLVLWYLLYKSFHGMLCVCVASLSFLERTFCFLSSQVSRDRLLWRGTAHVIPSPIPLPFLDIFSLSYVRWFILLMLYIVYDVLLVIAFLSLLTEMNPALWPGWTWLDSSSSITDRAFLRCVFPLFSGCLLDFWSRWHRGLTAYCRRCLDGLYHVLLL